MILGEDRKIGLCRAARKIIHYEIKGIPIDYALFHPAVLSEFSSLGIGVAIREVPAPLVTRSDIERNLRSEEHTSELQSLMRSSYAGFCLNKNKQIETTPTVNQLTSRRPSLTKTTTTSRNH